MLCEGFRCRGSGATIYLEIWGVRGACDVWMGCSRLVLKGSEDILLLGEGEGRGIHEFPHYHPSPTQS